MNKDQLESFYAKNYKKLMLIPIIVLIISLCYIGFFYSKNNDFIHKDITLSGGITATIYTEKDVNIEELSNKFEDSSVRKLADLTTGKQLGFIIEVSNIEEQELKKNLEEYLNIELNNDNYSVEETSSSLGASFYKELIIALAFAFLFMAIVVLITFRTLAPSIAVIFAAFADVVIALAFVDLIGMKVSAAGIIGFLLVIGYSIDTDILLTTRALKRTEGSLFERMFGSIKTGLTMTFSTLAALTIAFIFTTSSVLKEIFIIIIVALIADIFSTYFTNMGILTWYCKKKGIK